MSLAAPVTGLMVRHGATYTLRKTVVAAGPNAWTQGAGVASYSQCVAHERRYRREEIKGGILEGDVLLTVDAATLLQPIAAGDRIALGALVGDAGGEWRQVVSVYAPRIGARVGVYKVQARR